MPHIEGSFLDTPLFESEVVDALDKAAFKSGTSIISSRDMKVPLQLRPGGFFNWRDQNIGQFNPDGGLLGQLDILKKKAIHLSNYNASKRTIVDVLSTEMERVAKHLPTLFDEDNLFLSKIKEDKKNSIYLIGDPSFYNPGQNAIITNIQDPEEYEYIGDIE